MAWSGQRPVQWLLNHAPVDERWCLVHATHMTPDEYAGAARTGAVAGICPTTEANLGDGIFDMPLWLQHGGRWGVGSDSHACVNAAEELLMLEYGQRLSRRQRNVLASSSQPEVATAMTLQAVQGGAQASGRWGPVPQRHRGGPVGGLGGARCPACGLARPARARHAVGPCVCQPPHLGHRQCVGGRCKPWRRAAMRCMTRRWRFAAQRAPAPLHPTDAF